MEAKLKKRKPPWKIGFAGCLALILVAASTAFSVQSPQMPIAGKAIPQFVQPLPKLSLSPTGTGMTTIGGNQALTLKMCEFKAKVLPAGTVANYTGTWVWGYLSDPAPAGDSSCSQLIDLYDDGTVNGTANALDTYIGPVIISQRSTTDSTDITFVNDLGDTAGTHVLAYKYSTDQTLHWADPLATQVDGQANMCMMMGIPGYQTVCSLNYGEDPANPGTFLAKPIPAVPHLHGGEVPPQIDGSPDSWWTSFGGHYGHKYYSATGADANAAIYKYPNAQEAAPIWFHDHTLGATRLNVYMGLAGAYLLYDPALNLPTGLSQFGPLTDGVNPELIVPVVLQDRMFDTNGQLFMPADSAGGVLNALNPEHPYWVPEFVGDSIVVNGKAWPFQNVQPKRYVFWFLNGSNARTYEMFLVNPVTKAFGPPMYVLASDGGYLDAPAKIDPALGQKLLLQPGERYLVMIDFAGYAGTNLLLRNTGRTPYPKGASPTGTTLGQVMQFRVAAGAVADSSYNPASPTALPLRTGNQRIVRLPGTPLGQPIVTTPGPTQNVKVTRQLTLNEIMGMPVTTTDPVTGVTTAYPGGPLEILVNNTKWSGDSPRTYDDFTPYTVNGTTTAYSELPKEGDTEVWEIVNLTADAHPIHLHLVQFQLISRQNFNVNNYTAAYNAAFPGGAGFIPAFGPPLNYNTGNARALGGNPDIALMNKNGKPVYLQGMAAPPANYETGWKDTVIMYPGQVTKIAVRWAPTDLATNTAAANLHFPFDPNAGNAFNYVWHCHIVDHEDNEMMRPDVVQLNSAAPAPAARDLVQGVDY